MGGVTGYSVGVRSKHLTFHPQRHVSLHSARTGLSDLGIENSREVDPRLREGQWFLKRTRFFPCELGR